MYQFTQKECILMKILDCGSVDLELLEDIEYDLDDIIDDLMENNCLNFNELIREVFIRGAEDLAKALEDKKEDIKEDINNEIEDVIADFKLEYPDKTREEIIEMLDEMADDEWETISIHSMLIENEELNPEEDLDYYINYIDTHVYMKHLDFYQKWLPNELEEIERNMGWNFYEKYERD